MYFSLELVNKIVHASAKQLSTQRYKLYMSTLYRDHAISLRFIELYILLQTICSIMDVQRIERHFEGSKGMNIVFYLLVYERTRVCVCVCGFYEYRQEINKKTSFVLRNLIISYTTILTQECPIWTPYTSLKNYEDDS